MLEVGSVKDRFPYHNRKMTENYGKVPLHLSYRHILNHRVDHLLLFRTFRQISVRGFLVFKGYIALVLTPDFFALTL